MDDEPDHRVPPFGPVVAALALGQVLSWAALFYAFTSFVLPMQRELGWSRPLLMGAFTLGLVVNGLATYGVGAAIDQGRARLVMTGGALLAGAGFGLWAVARQPAQLYAAWALLGAAMAGTLYEPAFTVMARRYPQRLRAGITRLTLAGGFASTLCYPAVALLISRLGWRAALAVIGVVLLLVVAPLHAWALRGREAAAAPHGTAAGPDATLEQALRRPVFWLLTATFTGYAFVSAAFWAHAMPAFAGKGFSEAQATAVLVWFGPAQVAGRLAHAGFGHRLSTRVFGLAVLLAVPASIALFAVADGAAAMVVFAVVFGVANGLVTIVRGAIVPEFFGRTQIGRISGAMSAVALLSRAAAPFAAALLLLAVPGYAQVMVLLAGLGVASALAFAAATAQTPSAA